MVTQHGDISHTLTTRCGGAEEHGVGLGNGAPLVPVIASTLDTRRRPCTQSTLLPSNHGAACLAGWAVRRLTPRECERLQGYPDDHTLAPRGGKQKPLKDGPRYRAIGNGWARPVFAWVGRRIAEAMA